MGDKINTIISGAAGRDFFNFLTYYKNNPNHKVICFTAAQIPNIEKRKFPTALAGNKYPKGIPIYPESKLEKLIKKHNVKEVALSYSDLSHQAVMEFASRVLASGANFVLLGCPTMITSKVPVIAVCAVRTGAGKSQTSRKIAVYYKEKGYKVVVIRHPMPYGDLAEQQVQRFASYKDLAKHKCTIEEREEYEPHIDKGIIVYAGVDYKKILGKAEKEADIIIWDGGNNDIPFYKPDLWITIVDPHRPGNEIGYYPGMVNFLAADVLVINKIATASKKNISIVKENIAKYNPNATIIEAESALRIDNPSRIKGKSVLVVEDGPTLTHGGMLYGAGTIAAKKFKAKKIVDAKKFAVGSIKKVYEKYPQLSKVLPAMGYGKKQIKELQQTINKSKADAVIDGTPVNLSKLIKINKPIIVVNYYLKERNPKKFEKILDKILEA